MSRTYKRPYTKSKRFDASCRSHGGCGWCLSNRQHQSNIKQLSGTQQLAEHLGLRLDARNLNIKNIKHKES